MMPMSMKAPGIALVAVADDVFLCALLDARAACHFLPVGKAAAAPSPQARRESRRRISPRGVMSMHAAVAAA